MCILVAKNLQSVNSEAAKRGSVYSARKIQISGFVIFCQYLKNKPHTGTTFLLSTQKEKKDLF